MANETRTNGARKEVIAQALSDLKDHTEIAILLTFVLQKHGAIQASDLPGVLRALGARIHGATLRSALQGLKKRQIIAVNQAPHENGHVEERYEIRLAAFPTSLEVAHVTDLLPQLLRTEGAEKIKKLLEGEDKHGESKKRENTIREYRFASVTIQLMDPIYGSQILNPSFEAIRKRLGLKAFTDSDKVFERLTNGRIIIRADAFRGWFATNVTRLAGLGEAAASYLAMSPVQFHLGARVEQTVLPVVNSQRGGRAGVSPPVSYETLPAGSFAVFTLGWPIIGTFSSEQIEKLLHICGAIPRRGLSPARGGRTGRFRVVGFDMLGQLDDLPLTTSTELIPWSLLEKLTKEERDRLLRQDIVPQELSMEHLRYLLDAETRLKNVKLTDRKAGIGELEDDDDSDSA